MAGFNLPLVNPALGAPAVPSAMPSMPNLGASAPAAPSPVMAAPMSPSAPPPLMAPQTGGGGLQDVIKQLLPLLISGIAAKRGGPVAGNAVLTGYAQGLAKKHQDELEHQQMVAKVAATDAASRQQALEAQQKIDAAQQDRQYKLSQFVEKIVQQANAIDDPATFASMVALADKTAQQAFGAPVGFISGQLKFNDAKRLEKEQKVAQARVDAFLKQNPTTTLQDALTAGVEIQNPDGTRTPLSQLAALSNYAPAMLPSGERFQAPTPDQPTKISPYVDLAVAEAKRQFKIANPTKQWTGDLAKSAAEKAMRTEAGLKHIDSPTLGGASGSAPTVDDMNGDTQDILEGRNTMYNIRQTMGRTNAAAAYMNKLRRMIRAIDPKFDFVASDAGGKSVSTPYVQRAQIAVNSVLPNIDKIIELSNQVPRIGWKGVADLMQRGGVQFGNRPVTSLRQAQKLIADEIGVALGAGNVSDMKLQLGFDVTDPSVQPEVFADNMNTVREFILNRDKGLKSLRYHSASVDVPPPDGGRDGGPGPSGGAPPQNPKAGDTWNSPTGTVEWGKDVSGRMGWHPPSLIVK